MSLDVGLFPQLVPPRAAGYEASKRRLSANKKAEHQVLAPLTKKGSTLQLARLLLGSWRGVLWTLEDPLAVGLRALGSLLRPVRRVSRVRPGARGLKWLIGYTLAASSVRKFRT